MRPKKSSSYHMYRELTVFSCLVRDFVQLRVTAADKISV